MLEKRDFYINGAWVPSAGGTACEVIDPSTEEPCAIITLGSDADTDTAVAAAKAAFPAWAATPPGARLDYIRRLKDIFGKYQDDLGQAISMEMGAPIDMAIDYQAACMVPHIDAFIEAFDKIDWLRPLSAAAPGTMIAQEPIGVVGLITPWNWPINQIVLKVVPALLAGCTCVLKPSEETPLSAIIFAEMCHEIGLPAGVFNLVQGDGAGVGTRLSEHPDVAMISFTGSTRAGKAITRNAAETLKRVTLELGGKGANLVFADADPDAVRRGVMEVMLNAGQTCNAPTRMLVERPFYDRAVEIAAEVAAGVSVAPASAHGDHMGPVVNKRQWQLIQSAIATGIDEGARLVAGGTGLPDGLNRGYFVKPTVFADVLPGSSIEQKEIFGPVLAMIPFETEDEAVEIANNTAYGLSNFVQSQNAERRHRLAARLHSGMVEMNGEMPALGAFFGGVGASGQAREGGVWGIEEFLVSKAISGWLDTPAE